MKPSEIVIAPLDCPERAGDWHDKPLKYAVRGPGVEVQKFSVKRHAVLYRRLRLHSEAQQVAINEFARVAD